MKPLTTHIKYLDNFLLGILAGAAIGVGGFVNLLCLSQGLKICGGICFSIGLIMVCFFGFHLYTGKVGYLKDNDKTYPVSLVIMLLGNIIGAVGLGYLLRLTGIATTGILKDVMSVASNKIISVGGGPGQSVLKMVFNAILCNVFVFLAVDIYKKSSNWFIKIFGIVVCVAVFVICGFEHCVADMFYFAIANTYATDTMPAIFALVLAVLGNTVGALLTHFMVKEFALEKLF